ncbi:4-oxalocrotonate decarboxylase [Amycolatopsis rhizosphaerae]|uniref:4-oxalocrotonate decarboxylase n=1 Tax=Amycolatopsis rhizosphaerae TaxID=2053003 RepID=A0A558CPK2_9PSEU|nr:fumarylacetoacetate hydrolase family protein [Amycolatopsis rhizosphaerae]TVT50706.1 4-oxalocrotonate decarboxylase [Amycolatopsis rhizosphaerae]
MTGDWNVDRAATALLDCEHEVRDRGPLTEQWPGLDVPTAYAVQTETLRRRLSGGQRITGIKLGLTSRAKQRAMGVDTPLTGWLTDAMALAAGEPVPLPRFIHPRAEPEIVLVMGERLAGPGVTPEDALAAVAEVRAGLEVIDSRFRRFRFTLPDVIADNASSAGYVLGSVVRDPGDLDVSAETCVLEADGGPAGSATGAAVLGSPAAALALAANDLCTRGQAIEPGWLVFTGGLLDAVPLAPGSRVRARFGSLGELTLTA